MSEPAPKRAWITEEGTPKRHRRSKGRRLAVTDGEGSSPRFQASTRPVLLQMGLLCEEQFGTKSITLLQFRACRLHNLRVTY